MSLNNITFSSYKKFSGKECLSIRPVTILVGKNSSGKSSVLKLFPMLENSFSGELKKTPLMFDNNGVSLGVSFRNISHNGNSLGLSFGASFSDTLTIKVELISLKSERDIYINQYSILYKGSEYTLILQKDLKTYVCDQTGKSYSYEDFSGFINLILLKDIGYDLSLVPHLKVDYIGPIRTQPSRIYYSKGWEMMDKVGYSGEVAYDILCGSETLQKAVSEWFEENFNGCKLIVDPIDKGAYQICMIKKGNEGYPVNIIDEGQGMSQVLPIIVRCNMKEEGSIVLVEQPELHLHPAAHASLAKLFTKTAKGNNQKYIVETHSENIILGIREAIVDKNIPFTPDDAIIYFIDEDEEGAYLREIVIDEEGNLSEWPTGVFNESYELLKNIQNKAQNKQL